MFDDLKQSSEDKNTVDPGSNSNKNEPVGEMAMEDDASSTLPGPPSPAPPDPVDDMFGDVDPVSDKHSALQSGKIKPVSQTTDPQSIASVPSDLQIEQVAIEKDGTTRVKKIAAMLISIMLLAAIATAVYAYISSGSKNTETPIEENNEEQIEEVVEETEEEPVEQEEVIEEDITDDSQLDYDGDGLKNSEEDDWGTDPLEPDTDNDGVFDWDEVNLYESDPLEPDSDGDGLNDYDEINVWGTDPNIIDTDNDGYGDGVEVENAYNPFGDGDMDDFIPPSQRVTEE